jgi:hypothetical protein
MVGGFLSVLPTAENVKKKATVHRICAVFLMFFREGNMLQSFASGFRTF